MSAGWTAVNDPGRALPGHGHVYVIRVDGRARYVGQTVKSLTRRMWHHVRDADAGRRSYKANGLRKAMATGRTVTIEPMHVNVPHGLTLDAYEVEAIANLMAVGRCWNTNASVTRIDFDNLSPESRQAQSDAARRKWEDPEFAAMMSARAKAMWRGPGFAATASAKAKAQWQDPEFAAMKSAESKAAWQDPGFAAMMSAAVRSKWQDPEYAAMMSAKAKAMWQDPGFAAMQAAIKKRGHRGCGGMYGEGVFDTDWQLSQTCDTCANVRTMAPWYALSHLFVGAVVPSQRDLMAMFVKSDSRARDILADHFAGATLDELVARHGRARQNKSDQTQVAGRPASGQIDV